MPGACHIQKYKEKVGNIQKNMWAGKNAHSQAVNLSAIALAFVVLRPFENGLSNIKKTRGRVKKVQKNTTSEGHTRSVAASTSKDRPSQAWTTAWTAWTTARGCASAMLKGGCFSDNTLAHRQ